jgi:hypothetical protein
MSKGGLHVFFTDGKTTPQTIDVAIVEIKADKIIDAQSN